MRSVVRVASYLPVGVAEGVRVAGYDEDAFTLGAAAAERVLAERTERPGHLVVHLVGVFPSMADWGFAALLGQEAEVVHHPGTAAELTRTLRTLEAGLGGPAVIVASDLPERDLPSGGHAPPPPGAGAVAFLLESSDEESAFPVEKGSPNRSAVSAILRAGKLGRQEAGRAEFVGDWDASPPRGKAVEVEMVRQWANREPSHVSEGAYVPWARYIENLPSRWRLVADECDSCHEVTFPARAACRRCGRRDTLTPTYLPRTGARVAAITTIGRGGQPTEFDDQVEATGPYGVVLLDFLEGVRGTLQLTDAAPGEVHVGDPVQTFLRRLYPMEGEWRYGRKAAPLPSRSL